MPPGPRAPTARLRVVLAEPHAAFRAALLTLLRSDERLEVLGDAPDLDSATRIARRRGAHALIVADALLDHRDMLGPTAAGMRLVVLGMDDSAPHAAALREGGADAYVVKDQAHTRLVDALLGEC